jgi:hypothetical protein
MAEEKTARQMAEEALAAEGAPPLPPAPRTASALECSICGRDGGPVVSCEVCGGNQRFAQARAFSLTEERQGLNKEEKKDRYGLYGDVSPNIVVLPGGYDPRQGNKS